MKPRLRKLLLTAHVAVSVGWFGAAIAYIALAITGITTVDVEQARGAYLSLKLVGWFVIVPACFASLLTGILQSMGTDWGLFRHYWVSAKLLLTSVATLVLLGHMPAVSRMSEMAASPSWSRAESGVLPVQLVVHAAGGIMVLLVIVALSVLKPWGRTPYGRRKQRPQAGAT